MSAKKEEGSIFNKEFWISITRLSVSLVLLLLAYFVFNEANYGLWVNLAINLLAYLVVGYDILWRAFKNVIHLKDFFDEDFLMSIASIGAFCLRFFGSEHNDFFEAVLVVFLFQVGELFEDIATEKSHKAITDAVCLRAPFAHKCSKDKIETVDPASLHLDDVILVQVGEVLPADGIIIEGQGQLDMSSLTGESVPVLKDVGDEVNSGTILRQGSIKVRVDKEYENSTVSKILNLVEEGTNSKSKATRFVDKFSKYYTPIVCILALLIAVVPPLFLGISSGEVWEKWLYTALSLLVISCPCAIVISVPLAYFAGIGLASKNGLVIKGAAIFDKLSSLGLVVSDKTGTLTVGKFSMNVVHPEGIKEEQLLEYLRACESRSTHPIATAIIGDSDISKIANEVTSYDEVAGYGIKATYKGHKLLAGNEKLLQKNGIPFERSLEVGSIVYLAIDGKYSGYVVCADTIRKESLAFVDGLHKQNIKICMLTGDKEKNALAIAETLGLDEYHSELLPDEKTKILSSKLSKQGPMVAYMGDGINDAPSIALADVGIAMGGVGSDLAIQNADIVVMNDNPCRVLTALEVAKKTRIKVLSNIIVSLAIKLAVMLCAIFVPNFPLLIAVLADTGLTMVLVINSILLLYSHVHTVK